MQSQFLSEKERQRGRKYMTLFEIFNGISFGMLGDTLVYILAVRFHANNVILGLIPTIFYATSLVVPFLSKVLEGRNLGKTMYSMWVARGLVCLLYLLLLFTESYLRVWILIITYVLYTLFRAVGFVSYDPIAKNITTIHSRGAFYATLSFCYNGTIMVSKVIASLTTRFYDSILAIVILQMVGVVGNIFASEFARKIPCRLTYCKSHEMRILPVFKIIFKDAKIRNRVFLKWIFYIVTIVMGMTVPFMSVKVGLRDGEVILYSVIVSLGFIMAGVVSKFLSDRTGAKPLLLIASFMSIVTIFFFIASPPTLNFVLFYILGFFQNFFVQTAMIQANSLVVSAIPDSNAGAFNITVSFGAGLVALVAGLVSGQLVSIGERLDLSSSIVLLSDYSLCFGFALVFAVFGFIYAILLREKNAKKAHQLLSLRNLQAISQLSAIERSKDSFLRRKHIMYLGETSSSFVKQEIKQKLSSPYSREIHDLLQVIGEKKLSDYIPNCIEIASSDDNYMQITAIETLSNFTNNEDVAICLENVFRNSRWSSAKAEAAKSLSHFKGKEYLLDDIEKLSKAAIHIDVCVDYIIAMYYLDLKKNLFAGIFSMDLINRTKPFKQTRYSCYDALYINRNALSRLARLYEGINSLSSQSGLSQEKRLKECHDLYETFLEDYRSKQAVNDNYEALLNYLSSLSNSSPRDVAVELSDKLTASIVYRLDAHMIKNSLEEFKRNIDNVEICMTDIIAYLYFSILISAGDE